MFDSVLVANRGEIACRVIRTLRRMGIRSVAVFSDADAGARHVRMADLAVNIGPAAAAESYLNADRIVDVALAHGADAVHPGYGFLAENAKFAALCAQAGITFIGPGVHALEVMGDKIRAKAQVGLRGVPTVPGLAEPGLSDDELSRAVVQIGFPALIKPSAGGGGKGMHLVHHVGEVQEAIEAARREARSSFGDDTLFVERFVQSPRHIEVQVLADNNGTTIHLGERECSLQRRHQKVIEEAPSPLLDERTRALIGGAACETARSVDYRGAGTVEFIVSADAPGEFFFMEMNTRLQVEHPVTEMVTGLDLVEWQVRIAAGELLDFGQDDVELDGHAVEARIYAEDPAHGFVPTGGRVHQLAEPGGDGVRVDSSLVEGLVVSSDYDPMLAKVIAWAPDRPGALRKLRTALRGSAVVGVRTNTEFLGLLLDDPDVVAGRLDTELIGRRLDELHFARPDDRIFAAAALVRHHLEGIRAAMGPWGAHDGWRIGAAAPAVYRLTEPDAGVSAVVGITCCSGSVITVAVDEGLPLSASVVVDDPGVTVTIDGVVRTFRVAAAAGRLHLVRDGVEWSFIDTPPPRAAANGAAEHPELRSPMPGAVVAVSVADGDAVETGDGVLIIEAMKMEHVVRAPTAGTVSLLVEIGAQVQRDELVAVVTPHPVEAVGEGGASDESGGGSGEVTT